MSRDTRLLCAVSRLLDGARQRQRAVVCADVMSTCRYRRSVSAPHTSCGSAAHKRAPAEWQAQALCGLETSRGPRPVLFQKQAER
jgi:hypothetical protein